MARISARWSAVKKSESTVGFVTFQFAETRARSKPRLPST